MKATSGWTEIPVVTQQQPEAGRLFQSPKGGLYWDEAYTLPVHFKDGKMIPIKKWYIREDGKFENVEELADRADKHDLDALEITNQLGSAALRKDSKGYYAWANELQ